MTKFNSITELEAQLERERTSRQQAQRDLEAVKVRHARIGLDIDRALRGEVNEQSPITSRLRAIAQAVADEREACAQVCENSPLLRRITELEAENAGLEASCSTLGRLVDELRDHADLYRYLRERPLSTIEDGGVFAGMTPQNVVLNGDDLDAAIRARRQ